jgi:uncharacterized protein (TIGR01777 family)
LKESSGDFFYRGRALILQLKPHSKKGGETLNILVSGASGLLGSALIPFLTARGHRVVTLVRRAPILEKEEIFWDPVAGYLDPKSVAEIDAIIHLAGENISQGRWTKRKKKRIMESRTKGTALVAETAVCLEPFPEVLVCASAIGYYGDRDDRLLVEGDTPGNDFVSKVCVEWEKATEPASQKGIRVVLMRFGIVLSPEGGALARLLWPFKMGLGGKLGPGNQYMSWVAIDDAVKVMDHVLSDGSLFGPVNVVSPNPVTNLEFTKILGKVLSRPTLLNISTPVIKLVFGEMGKELLLSSTRVEPKRLLETGYRFRFPDLGDTLLHLIANHYMQGRLQ